MTSEDTGCEITLITPMYNEADKIQANIGSILEAMDRLEVPWEYILVDDGSTDDSLALAQAALSDRPNCRVVHYRGNRGRGYALRQGFAAARGRFIVTTESDLSWGARIIARLHEALKDRDDDVVIASVYQPGGGLQNVPAFRRYLSKWGNRVMRWAYGGDLTMLSGMTRGYRRRVIDSLLLESDRKEIHLEIVTKAQTLGYRISEIPATITWSPPEPGVRKRSGLGMLRFVLPHLLVSFHRASVKTLALAMVLTGLLGLVLICLGTLNKLFLILWPMPNLVTYGLILCVMAILLAMFVLVSIQLWFVNRSMVHTQAQLRELQRTPRERARDSE